VERGLEARLDMADNIPLIDPDLGIHRNTLFR
jgi:hypothetical protein